MTISAREILNRVVAGHAEMLLLCEHLEAVADGLPDHFDHRICNLLASTLSDRILAAQTFEESAMFPLLMTCPALRDEMQAVLAELHQEHQMDLYQAEDVQEMLGSYAKDQPDASQDVAGFMLRALFEGIRRHIRFEQTLLLPLALICRSRSAPAMTMP